MWFKISGDFEGGSLGPRLLLTAPFPLHHRSRCSGNHIGAPESRSSNTQAGHPPPGPDGPGRQRQGVPEEVKAWALRELGYRHLGLPQTSPGTDPWLNRKGTQIVLWTEDQELELQRLFEEFRDSDGE